MKSKCIKFAGLTISIAVISACSPEFENPVPGLADDSASYSTGNADFSTFVTIGDSLTAGFADGALYQSGQENSYPAIIAKQIELAEGIEREFKQPLMNDNLGGLLFDGATGLDSDGKPVFGNRLVFNVLTRSPEPMAGNPVTEVVTAPPLTGPFNNVGVPGAKSFHLGLPGYGNANPYYARFASSTTSTVIGDAAIQTPTFIVMWVGNNDVLSYASSGGTGDDQTGNQDLIDYGPDDITDPTSFADTYGNLLGAIQSANADVKGVLVNIPDISSIPFFTAVPHNPIPLDQTNADALNDITAYGGYNAGLWVAFQQGAITEVEYNRRLITFTASTDNAVVIIDEDLTDLTDLTANPGLINMRQATADDFVLLTSSSLIGEPVAENNPALWGISAPFLDEHVLTKDEVEIVNTARLAFNATIKQTAENSDNFVFYDVAAVMAGLKTQGIDYGSGFIDANYVSGGAFSLDGVHPTARGYAVIANQMIAEINTGFDANIPKVDPADYSTIFFK